MKAVFDAEIYSDVITHTFSMRTLVNGIRDHVKIKK